MERVLLVGESNPHSSDPRHALHPHPPGAAGSRLCKILGMQPCEYLEKFDRVNLLRTAEWSPVKARNAARKLTHRRRILLGARVAAAHGIKFYPFCRFTLEDDVRVLILPHPSGRCRIWNDRTAFVSAREAIGRFMEETKG